MLAGLIFPKTGYVKFYGRLLREDQLNDAPFQRFFRSRVGIVFQNSDIQLFNSSVEDEILFGLTQLELSKDEIARRFKEYMSLMGIEGLKDRHPQYLSIGEKKRVAIASVLVMEPEVLILDEPTAGLDTRTTRHLIEAVSAFGKRGCTIITATQDIHIVPEIAERVVVLGEDKKIVKDASSEEVLRDAQFLKDQNLIHRHVHIHKDVIHTHMHQHPTHDHPH
jgi:cobalt/nickel transport system ATP-binding protein